MIFPESVRLCFPLWYMVRLGRLCSEREHKSGSGLVCADPKSPHSRAKTRVHHASLNLQPCFCLDSGRRLLRIHTTSSFHLSLHLLQSPNNAFSSHLLIGRGRVSALFLHAVRVLSVVAQQRKQPDTVILPQQSSRGTPLFSLQKSSIFLDFFLLDVGAFPLYFCVRSRVWSFVLRRHGYGLGFVSLRGRVLAEPHPHQVLGSLQVYLRSQGCSEDYTVSQSPGGRVPASDFRVLGFQSR